MSLLEDILTKISESKDILIPSFIIGTAAYLMHYGHKYFSKNSRGDSNYQPRN